MSERVNDDTLYGEKDGRSASQMYLGIALRSLDTVIWVARHAMRTQEVAEIDDKTHLAREEPFQQQVDSELEKLYRSKETGRVSDVGAVAFLFIDIEQFKLINDQRGHNEGDRVLGILGDVVYLSIREEDVLAARLGGDELGIGLLAGSAKSARRAGKTVRERIRTNFDTHLQREGITALSQGVGLSIGIAVAARTEPRTTYAELKEAADADMYKDKAARRQSGEYGRSR